MYKSIILLYTLILYITYYNLRARNQQFFLNSIPKPTFVNVITFSCKDTIPYNKNCWNHCKRYFMATWLRSQASTKTSKQRGLSGEAKTKTLNVKR